MEFVSWDIRANVMDGIVALPKAYQLVREREIDISRGLKVWRVGTDDEGRLTARRRGLVVNQWTWRSSLGKASSSSFGDSSLLSIRGVEKWPV